MASPVRMGYLKSAGKAYWGLPHPVGLLTVAIKAEVISSGKERHPIRPSQTLQVIPELIADLTYEKASNAYKALISSSV